MNQPTDFNIQQEADYVLGMMEMYDSDDEIAGILRTKGLTPIQINEVLALVRMEGYRKRLRQAKRIMLIGIGITIAASIPYLLWWDELGNFTRERDPLARGYTKGITGYVFYGLLYGVGQSIYGAYRYILYRNKIQKFS
jgi:hypothetical protein